MLSKKLKATCHFLKILNLAYGMLSAVVDRNQRCAGPEILSWSQSMDFDQRSASAALCNLESAVSARPQMTPLEICACVMKFIGDRPSTEHSLTVSNILL